jgi:PDZ domain
MGRQQRGRFGEVVAVSSDRIPWLPTVSLRAQGEWHIIFVEVESFSARGDLVMARKATRRFSIAAFMAGIALSATATAQQPSRPTFPPRSPPPAPAPPQAAPSLRPPAVPIGPLPRPATRAAPAAPRIKPTPEQIDAWIRELDADEFFTRETATVQLLEAGPVVLSALKPVLSGGSLEATSRALYIVRQIGVAADIDTQDEAGRLLMELAGRQETPALARRAAATLDELTQQRSAYALAELEELGAKIARSQAIGAVLPEEPAISIELSETFRGDEHDLRRLKWVTSAPVLILSGKQVTDGWIKHAAAMPGLDELHLYQARISDDGLAPLSESATLKQLGLYYTPVTEAVLAPVSKLPLLAFIKLYGTKVSREGVVKFKNATGMAVDHRRGAFLGVGVLGFDDTCRISTIHDDSPAAKAGLLRDDTIVRFGDEAVGNFGSLTELISQRDVGEEVEMEVIRGTIGDEGLPTPRRITTKVLLAPWELEPAVRNSRR